MGIEAALILVGVADITTLIRLRGAPGRAEPGVISLLGEQLVAHYDAVFLLSQSLMPGLNALLLGTLLLRSGLVPRALPLIGLVGAQRAERAVQVGRDGAGGDPQAGGRLGGAEAQQ